MSPAAAPAGRLTPLLVPADEDFNEELATVLARAIHEATAPLITRIAALEARPQMKYVGVYNGSVAYEAGSIVTYSGCLYHCNTTTADRPGTSGAWTLCVKAGRDGKDLR